MEPPRRPVAHPAPDGGPPEGVLPPGARWRRSVGPITKGRVLVLVALFGLIVVADQTCQKKQVRLTKTQAVVKARPYAGFVPQRTQVRFIRQGLKSKPFWAVSFSIPEKKGGGYLRLTTVRVDANTGKVVAVNRTKGRQPSGLP
jgi:hypothetical protein